ncbi:MAG: hypothetical protein RH917_05140 [Lacipirellulaceae bacterium]
MFKKFLAVAVVATGMTFVGGSDAEARPFVARRVVAPVRTVAPVRRTVGVVAPVRRVVAAPVARTVVRPAVVAPVVRPVVRPAIVRPAYPVYGGAYYGGAYYTPDVSVSVGF